MSHCCPAPGNHSWAYPIVPALEQFKFNKTTWYSSAACHLPHTGPQKCITFHSKWKNEYQSSHVWTRPLPPNLITSHWSEPVPIKHLALGIPKEVIIPDHKNKAWEEKYECKEDPKSDQCLLWFSIITCFPITTRQMEKCVRGHYYPIITNVMKAATTVPLSSIPSHDKAQAPLPLEFHSSFASSSLLPHRESLQHCSKPMLSVPLTLLYQKE